MASASPLLGGRGARTAQFERVNRIIGAFTVLFAIMALIFTELTGNCEARAGGRPEPVTPGR